MSRDHGCRPEIGTKSESGVPWVDEDCEQGAGCPRMDTTDERRRYGMPFVNCEVNLEETTPSNYDDDDELTRGD